MTLLPFLLLALAADAPAEASKALPAAKPAASKTAGRPSKIKRGPKLPGPAPERPVNITAESFELLPESHQAVWRGNVLVERDDVKVTCDRLTADYDEQKRLNKLSCNGNGHVLQRARGPKLPDREAWGEKIVYENDSATVVVTGSPRAREGANSMRGDRVMVLLAEDRMVVEGNVQMILETTPPGGAEARRP